MKSLSYKKFLFIIALFIGLVALGSTIGCTKYIYNSDLDTITRNGAPAVAPSTGGLKGDPAEVCDNNLDDDNDGAIDCLDQDCFNDTSCSNPSLINAGDICEEYKRIISDKTFPSDIAKPVSSPDLCFFDYNKCPQGTPPLPDVFTLSYGAVVPVGVPKKILCASSPVPISIGPTIFDPAKSLQQEWIFTLENWDKPKIKKSGSYYIDAIDWVRDTSGNDMQLWYDPSLLTNYYNIDIGFGTNTELGTLKILKSSVNNISNKIGIKDDLRIASGLVYFLLGSGENTIGTAYYNKAQGVEIDSISSANNSTALLSHLNSNDLGLISAAFNQEATSGKTSSFVAPFSFALDFTSEPPPFSDGKYVVLIRVEDNNIIADFIAIQTSMSDEEIIKFFSKWGSIVMFPGVTPKPQAPQTSGFKFEFMGRYKINPNDYIGKSVSYDYYAKIFINAINSNTKTGKDLIHKSWIEIIELIQVTNNINPISLKPSDLDIPVGIKRVDTGLWSGYLEEDAVIIKKQDQILNKIPYIEITNFIKERFNLNIEATIFNVDVISLRPFATSVWYLLDQFQNLDGLKDIAVIVVKDQKLNPDGIIFLPVPISP